MTVRQQIQATIDASSLILYRLQMDWNNRRLENVWQYLISRQITLSQFDNPYQIDTVVQNS